MRAQRFRLSARHSASGRANSAKASGCCSINEAIASAVSSTCSSPKELRSSSVSTAAPVPLGKRSSNERKPSWRNTGTNFSACGSSAMRLSNSTGALRSMVASSLLSSASARCSSSRSRSLPFCSASAVSSTFSSEPYWAISFTIAEPTIAPSEISAIFAACSGVEIPKPTAHGTEEFSLTSFTREEISVRISLRTPVTPRLDTI